MARKKRHLTMAEVDAAMQPPIPVTRDDLARVRTAADARALMVAHFQVPPAHLTVAAQGDGSFVVTFGSGEDRRVRYGR